MSLPSRLRMTVLVVVLIAAGALAGGIALALHPAIAPAPPPDRSTFQQSQIAQGAELAAIGDCAVCHTAAGGRSYAGGRAVPTPFGNVYATNITPDAETGIGQWSLAAFRRAMRYGIGRTGHHLYPVLPYPHFTRANDEDIDAMYAFLMTRTAIRQTPPPNQLVFPLNHRVLLAGWNLLYLRPGPWQADPAHDAVWNRGAYLVEAIAHCGACHTPHNALGAEQSGRRLGGGEAEGWYAPALQAASPARRAWTADALATYLRTGFQAQHGAAGGPMTAVTEELASVPDTDIRAIATYIAALMPRPMVGSQPGATSQSASQDVTTAQTTPSQPAVATGPVARGPLSSSNAAAQAIFAGACGGCHDTDAPMTGNGAPPLSLSNAVNAPTPRDAIQIILHGIPWRDGKPAPYMPEFAAVLTDAQLILLVGYLRTQYSDQAAWSDLPAEVAQARQGGGA